MRDVLAFLAERGYADVQSVVAAEESLLFALPNELRRDLKARSGGDPAPTGAIPARRRPTPCTDPSALSLLRPLSGRRWSAGCSLDRPGATALHGIGVVDQYRTGEPTAPRSASSAPKSSAAVSGRGATATGSGEGTLAD